MNEPSTQIGPGGGLSCSVCGGDRTDPDQRAGTDCPVRVKEQVSDAASTHDLVAAELGRLGGDQTRIVVQRCEKATQFRASQLDLAVDYARDRFSGEIDDSTRLWVGVYNADSRPQAQTFAELAEQVDTDPDVRVFQQLVDYVVPARGRGREVRAAKASA